MSESSQYSVPHDRLVMVVGVVTGLDIVGIGCGGSTCFHRCSRKVLSVDY